MIWIISALITNQLFVPDLIDLPSLPRRLASMLYDSLLVAAILFVATFLFIVVFGSATEFPKRHFFQVYLWVVAAIYFIWCWMHGGQTLAMQTWRVRLVDSQGRSLAFGQAIRRYILASLGLMFFGAGFFWALFDREGLFLHDRLSGSRLILANAP